VEICREVRRVLRDDGVFWLNYGDVFSGGGRGKSDTPKQASNAGHGETGSGYRGINAGNLMMMPHRIALALQADDWIIRQDLVWFKRNPMPESVNGWRWQRERERSAGQWSDQEISNRQDGHSGHISNRPKTEYEYGDDLELRKGSWRHTRAHEYVFMLVKGMQYWSNQEAVRERHADKSFTVHTTPRKGTGVESKGERFNLWLEEEGRGRQLNPSGRNPRSVLDIPTQPYKGSHYATFPVNLIAPLIRATCPRWACPVCGQGWAPVVDKSTSFESGSGKAGRGGGELAGKHQEIETLHSGDGHDVRLGPVVHSNVLGYKPTCEHPHTQEEAIPGIVLDPFVGSGTTVAVAKSLLRRGIGIDISMEYLDQQAKIRAGLGTPSNVLEDLPLFADML